MTLRSVIKKLFPKAVFRFIEPYGHLLEAFVTNCLNGFPGRGLKVIGVTGTNGKTSTSFMIHKLLQESGYKTGLMTTVSWGVGNDIKEQVQHWTNVPLPVFMKRLKIMRSNKIDWLVLETTSQALAQNRIYGIKYSVAVMTNVTHEHLDYHRTFTRYVNAKRKMFKLANRNRKGLRTGVINAEDPSAELFAKDIKYPILYGINKGELVAEKINSSPSGSTFTAKIDNDEYQIVSHLPGTFNIFNSLAAIGAVRAIGLSKEQIESGIAALSSVKGRMTKIDDGQDFDLIVDYAHTPDSFEKLFKDIKLLTKGKLIVMFGSPGRRDEAKRAQQGELAGKYADEIVLTEEDDRDADGEKILSEIADGVKKHKKQEGKDLFLVHDRKKAIRFAVARASKGDTVLLLGKGHEKTIETSGGEIPWNEIEEAHKAIKHIQNN